MATRTTRRSPETRPVHLTRADLRRAIDAIENRVVGVGGPAQERPYNAVRNKLRRVLADWG